MSKKHFIALAALIKANREQYTDQQIQDLSGFCASFGPNFDRARFVEACGVAK